MRREIMHPGSVGQPGRVAAFDGSQIAQRRTWAMVPDEQTALAAMHVLHVNLVNGTTITELNPLDVGTVADRRADADNDFGGRGWLDIPHAAGTFLPAAR